MSLREMLGRESINSFIKKEPTLVIYDEQIIIIRNVPKMKLLYIYRVKLMD